MKRWLRPIAKFEDNAQLRADAQLADDLTEGWVEDWAYEGISAIESYLAKHAAFLTFLDTQDD